MSHEPYCNYSNLMEIELAALQDMGYTLDRRNYFGYSLYRDGVTLVNNRPYTARNTDGSGYLDNTYNATALGVGLHIYGSGNTVTQNAPILTNGTGGIGIRVDGINNNIIVDKNTQVQSDGDSGVGIWTAYGKNHELKVDGKVTANGKDGIAIRCDFGSSSNGSSDEYRGSYIRWNKIIREKDPVMVVGDPDNELNGPQVKSININGYVSGAKQAIYISNNTLVSQININSGAKLSGDITSDWMDPLMALTFKPVYQQKVTDGEYAMQNRDLRLQFNGDTETLATDLNFQGQNLSYNGNITGKNNMRLKIAGGSLAYTGTANVINSTVAANAALAVNGEINLNQAAKTMALYNPNTDTINDDGVAFKNAGEFFNYGTIAPLATANKAADKFLITGNLQNSSQLGLTADTQGARLIQVSGTAKLQTGSKVVATAGSSYLPGNTYTVLTAGSIATGSTIAATPEFSGMLSAVSKIENNTVTTALSKANNLGLMSAQEQETYQAIDQMFDVLSQSNNAGQSLLRAAALSNSMAIPNNAIDMGLLYGFNAADAKQALREIKGSDDVTAAALRSARQNVYADRVANALSTRTAEEFAQAQNTYHIWADISKNWNTFSNMNGQQYLSILGADKQIAPQRRFGFYLGYGKNSFSGTNQSAELKDLRLGVYHSQQNGTWNYLTQLAYGHQNNDTTRMLPTLGLKADGRFGSDLVAASFQADQTSAKQNSWALLPYFNAEVSYYKQQAYQESGASVYGHNVHSQSGVYATVGAGVGFQRLVDKLALKATLGYKRVLLGNDPTLIYSYAGNAAQSYTENNSKIGRDYLTAGLSAAGQIAPNTNLQFEAALERAKGHTYKMFSANIVWSF